MDHEWRPRRTVLITVTLLGLLVLGVLLMGVFSGRWTIDPVAVSLGPVSIHWYGLIIASAILMALPWVVQRAERRGLDRSTVERVLWWAVIGGVLGARLVFVVQNLDYFGAHLGRILALVDGGLSIHGAILGGAVALRVTLGFDRQNFWRVMDAAVPGLLLGMILGRFGNLANAELFGPPTNQPWKLFIPEVARPPGLEAVAFYHPTFLYDALLNAALLAGLLWIERRWSLAPGRLTLFFLIGIAATRFTVEFWRLGSSVLVGLSLAQLVSVVIALVASLGLWLRRSMRP
ncbi:prolipoprotein diacylglyceryl transferase [Candidatus Berkelbacteria bacterium]|nr:prolipoprotein diacylglyceryl transferase [Candidatus Berkelbacteria bacterium]